MAKGKQRVKVKPQDLLPVLDVDLSLGPGNVILPCPESRQANHLGWGVAAVRSTNKNFKVLNNLPMICKAQDCYWASQCETAPDFLWEGLRCPLETLEIYKHWVGYIKELEVGPSDYVDLKMVADLVRIELQLMRMDQELQINGFMVDTVGGIIQNAGKDKGGKAVYERNVHPVLAAQTKLRKDRNDIYEQLEASREAKRKARNAEGKTEQNFLEFMAKVRKSALPGNKIPEIIEGEAFEVQPTKALSDNNETNETLDYIDGL